NARDLQIEGAVAYARTALLNEPAVIRELHRLADLRELKPGWTMEGFTHYRRDVESSLLREQFTAEEIDHLARVIRERQRLGVWGLAKPVNPAGKGYGREGQRPRQDE